MLYQLSYSSLLRAGEGNRTLVFSLEGCCSTIELHPLLIYPWSRTTSAHDSTSLHPPNSALCVRTIPSVSDGDCLPGRQFDCSDPPQACQKLAWVAPIDSLVRSTIPYSLPLWPRFANGRCRIRTCETEVTDLQSVPFNHSGNLPETTPKSSTGTLLSAKLRSCLQPMVAKQTRSQRRDSNPRPADYKSAALPAELRWPGDFSGSD